MKRTLSVILRKKKTNKSYIYNLRTIHASFSRENAVFSWMESLCYLTSLQYTSEVCFLFLSNATMISFPQINIHLSPPEWAFKQPLKTVDEDQMKCEK